MSLKVEFVELASRKGANKSALCREFGISRETGHKWLRRFRKAGYEGLDEQSRRPRSSPLSRGEDIVMAVLKAREAHPRWGSQKLADLLRRSLAKEAPSRATIARILTRFGLIRKRRSKRPLNIVERAPTVRAKASNDVWTVDFKGWWRTRDGARCEPLTIRDAYSRFILCTKLMGTSRMAKVREEFERLFRKYGLPAAIQCDNGNPFICVQSRGGLTALSAWWISLGIRIVRSRPGCPQDNGGHERMHRDLRAEIEAFPGLNLRAEQRAMDRWRQQFNHVRPHEALDGKTPTEVYRPSKRRALRPLRPSYPSHWVVRRANPPSGRIWIDGQELALGRALIGRMVGLEPLEDRRHRVWFNDVDLGEVVIPYWNKQIDRACDQFLDGRLNRKKRAA